MLDAALAGRGLACVPEDKVTPYIGSGRLVRVLEDWCPPNDGYNLCYLSKRHPTPAFRLLIEKLRGGTMGRHGHSNR